MPHRFFSFSSIKSSTNAPPCRRIVVVVVSSTALRPAAQRCVPIFGAQQDLGALCSRRRPSLRVYFAFPVSFSRITLAGNMCHFGRIYHFYGRRVLDTWRYYMLLRECLGRRAGLLRSEVAGSGVLEVKTVVVRGPGGGGREEGGRATERARRQGLSRRYYR